MDGNIKMQRIKAENRVQLDRLAEILNPSVLHTAVPRLATAEEGRKELKGRLNEMSTLGSYCRTNGFDPTRSFQHVATIEQSVWSAILESFAKYNEAGELIHDGLLYKSDEDGTVKLNKDFFYALIGFLNESGYQCDMRNKIKLN
jgi:hypothetical protein